MRSAGRNDSQLAPAMTGVASDDLQNRPPEKNPAAVELGRRGGLKGGVARAARMTPEERTASARLAAVARWSRDCGGLQEGDGRGEGDAGRWLINST
jgi:hypothetical protein